MASDRCDFDASRLLRVEPTKVLVRKFDDVPVFGSDVQEREVVKIDFG